VVIRSWAGSGTLALAMGFWLGLVGIFTVLPLSIPFPSLLWWLGPAACVAFAIYRAGRVKVVIDDDEVQIQNFWKAYRYPWAEVTEIVATIAPIFGPQAIRCLGLKVQGREKPVPMTATVPGGLGLREHPSKSAHRLVERFEAISAPRGVTFTVTAKELSG
jgi:hypothetical protein